MAEGGKASAWGESSEGNSVKDFDMSRNEGGPLTMAKPVKSPFDRDGGRRFTELEIPDRKLTKEQKKTADEFARLLNEYKKKKKKK